MTYAQMGSLGVRRGCREAVVAILTRPDPALAAGSGCLSYEVGVDPDDPDRIHSCELWTSAEAHRASLQLDSVQAAIAEAMPMLSGEMSGTGFEVLGSPLRG